MITVGTIIELTKEDPECKNFWWVAKACGVTVPFNTENVLCIRDNAVYATDGHRAHAYYPKTEYIDGIYKILINRKYHIVLISAPSDAKFPEIEKVFPEHKDFKEVDLHGDLSTAYTRLIREMSDEKTIKINYFQDAIKTDLDIIAFLYKETMQGKHLPIVFTESFKPERKALIMPMNT